MFSVLMTIVFSSAMVWVLIQKSYSPLRAHGYIDAIVPAFNEELCIEQTVKSLTVNPYFRHVIVVDDGSTDQTAHVLDALLSSQPKLRIISQQNTGKGGALMAGIRASRAPLVFLTDGDTLVPNDDGLGYMMGEMERGADAVGGIALSNLDGATLLPHIRASTKLACIMLVRTFQQMVGGSPFLISGACGLFKRKVLLDVPFSDRTNVEDLDLTWSLISKGYKVKQASRAFVYSQECNSLKSEWLRWRRWIAGYGVCMRLHSGLLTTRFGIGTILPVFLTSFLASALVLSSIVSLVADAAGPRHHLTIFNVIWLGLLIGVSAASAVHHRKPWLMIIAPLTVFYAAMSSVIWLVHGLKGLLSGSEPQRDKPQRYANVVA